MTIFLEKVTSLAAYVFVILLHSSFVLSVTFSRKGFDVIKIENQPFEFECTATGTQDELKDITIVWTRPGSNRNIPPEGDSHVNITVERRDEVLTSTLHVPRPLDLGSANVQHYQCILKPSIKGQVNQYSFAIRVLKVNAVPKIQPIEVLPAKFKETVVLNCSVSYDNDALNPQYDLILSWKKDRKLLVNKTYKYNVGNYTETFQYTLVIKSFRDGGDYVCSWELKEGKNSITQNSTVVLPILPFLTGPALKEVKDVAGSDVKLTCDVVGYPIKFEWRDEMNALIVSDSRIRPDENMLYIDDIDYEDRKKYKCLGIGENGTTIIQTIILRVKDPLAPLWPFIGIVVEAFLVGAIIVLCGLYNKRKQSDKDGSVPKTETTDQPSTSQT